MFLGVGAPLGVGLGIPGDDAEGITDALAFLRTYNLRGSVPVGKNVVVIGGGNSAIDAARTGRAPRRRERSPSSTAAAARSCRPTRRKSKRPSTKASSCGC